MSIDHIGKSGAPPPPTPPITETEKPKGAEAEAQSTGALARLRAGEIDLDGYLDLKVNEATAHLHGLRAAEMEGIRSMLRDQIARDPALADLVLQATGQSPAPKE